MTAAKCLPILLFMAANVGVQAYDLLTIVEVKCVRSATGIDSAARAGASALGGAIGAGVAALVGGTAIVTSGGTATPLVVPVTKGALVSAASGGASAAVGALEFLSRSSSGQDDLVVEVNGMRVWPSSGKYYPIKPGQSFRPNARVSFDRGARIQLVEYDSGSDDDDLGHIDVRVEGTENQAGQSYTVREAVVFSEEEGSVYLVTYKVDVGAGDTSRGQWQMCGTARCRACSTNECGSDSSSGLDRDGDTEDLKSCPFPLRHKRYRTWPQTWPFEDVHLRVCGP